MPNTMLHAMHRACPKHSSTQCTLLTQRYSLTYPRLEQTILRFVSRANRAVDKSISAVTQ